MVKTQSPSKVPPRQSTRKVESQNDDKKSTITTPKKSKVSCAINDLNLVRP
jgi:hypothetical protein